MEAGRAAPSSRPTVFIVGDFGFPYGSGASSRVFNYARGLQAAGATVKVLCVEPGARSDAPLNVAARGTYRGVPFEYTYGRTTRPDSTPYRRLLRLAKWPRFVWAVRRSVGPGGLDAMLVYSRSLPCIAVSWLTCRLLGATVLHEDCELPFVWKADTPANRARRWLLENVAYKGFDGCIVISTYLEAYCRRRLRAGAGTLLVPILVDVDDVAPGDGGGAAAAPAARRVAYCGYMNHPEVRTTLDAFATIAADFPDVRLQLIGGALRPEAVPELRDRIAELGLTDRVELTGQVGREDLFGLLAAASVLVLPRARAAFSEAGLPTKVAEYLASGTPVVVTAVGDLPLYLRDGVDAYLATPGDEAAFAARLREALVDPHAPDVGRQGRRTAAEKFDPAGHGRRILAFVRALREGTPYEERP